MRLGKAWRYAARRRARLQSDPQLKHGSLFPL